MLAPVQAPAAGDAFADEWSKFLLKDAGVAIMSPVPHPDGSRGTFTKQ